MWTRRQLLGSLALAQTPSQRPPNIVLILCDDLGLGDATPYNPDSQIRTPNLDRLAREGTRYTDAHSPSSVCTPTRYGVMTGRYCWRTSLKRGVLNGASPALIEPGRATIASLLKQRGYRTGGFGKWHLGLGTAAKTDYSAELRPSPNDYGFDEYFGIPASLDMPPYLYFENRQAVEQPTATIPDNGEAKRGPYWRGGAIAPSFKIDGVLGTLGDRACRFIAAKSAQPYFAYVPLTGPHTPWAPSAEFHGKSKIGLYGDFVEEVDAVIGRILKAVDATGEAANTLVIVTSDNGAPWEKRDWEENGAHWANTLGVRGQKSDAYDGGHRIPFFLRWPGRVRPGGVSDKLICLTDICATLAHAAGVPLTDSIAEDSVNILNGPARTSVVHHSGDGLFALRMGDWKLIEGLGSGGFTLPAKITPGAKDPAGQLYNLKEDPLELRNRYAIEPAVVARLMAELNRIRQNPRSR
jgi:arylsulfatase A-like enzyme